MTKRTFRSMIVVLMLVAVGLFFISGTYARYVSTASGTASVEVAKWAVKVNSADITSVSTFDLEDFTLVANANVADGKIAPSSELYTDLEINTTGSEVAVDYALELGAIAGLTGDYANANVAISKVVTVADDATETEINLADGKYSGTIELADVNTPVTVRVYVKWVNGDDVVDTAAGIAAPELSIPVTATATQHIG